MECYEKEMIDRSSHKVLASKKAAQFLHTEVAIQKGDITRGEAWKRSDLNSSALESTKE